MRALLLVIALFSGEGWSPEWTRLPRQRPIGVADLIGMVLAHAVAIIGLGGGMCALALLVVLFVRLFV